MEIECPYSRLGTKVLVIFTVPKVFSFCCFPQTLTFTPQPGDIELPVRWAEWFIVAPYALLTEDYESSEMWQRVA
jgi:hypothetical protein